MPDIGDDVDITTTVTVDGTLTTPGSITILVTAPSGATTNPTVTETSTGNFKAVADAVGEAGRWQYRFTTTSPDGVEYGHFDVSGNPPPPDRLMPLATVADLEERQTLTDAQKTRAPALLRDASARIRGYTKQTFDLTLNDVLVLRPVGSALRLPQRPVIAVDQVVQVGAAGTADRVMAATEWAWDGLDRIELWPEAYRCQWPTVTGVYADVYRVTCDHGYPTSPDVAVSVCCSMVLRVLTAPSPVEGMSSETIGQYSYRLAAGSPGTKVRLTEDDKQELRDAGFRRTAGTVQLRAG